ncbi:MAG: PilT/PilU family type 4a pilus ATPase [Actinomycetota bacterium]|nr:PilT/PilU family type 4a pilus ATPase [Actinomycetota bacterium]
MALLVSQFDGAAPLEAGASAVEGDLATTPVELEQILTAAVALGASDVHVRAGAPPLLRVSGQLFPLDLPDLTEQDASALVGQAMTSGADQAAFIRDHECDFALVSNSAARFRVNAYRARGADAMVLRLVREQVPSLVELGLPNVTGTLARATAGLVLVCGPTGSGKSTTLAALVDLINEERRCHILTIEDPIEFIHRNKLATISQRELHTDTFDFAQALRSGLRQDPDVILIGEIRDVETMRTALQAAETGHLVLASLHAKSVVDAVHRIVDMFPADEQRQARASVAESLQGILCQQLVASARGDGRVLICEVAVATPRVKEAVADSTKTALLGEIITDGEYYGMRSFEQDAVRLVLAGDVSLREAETVASNVTDLLVALRRAGFRE